MNPPWNTALEHYMLQHPDNWREFEERSYRHDINMYDIDRMLEEFVDRFTAGDPGLPFVRSEIAALTKAVFYAGQFWKDTQTTARMLNYGSVSEAAHYVSRVEVAEEDAFVENKDCRVTLAERIMALLDDPTSEIARVAARAEVYAALMAPDIENGLDLPITEEYFLQLLQDAHRPDSQNYQPYRSPTHQEIRNQDIYTRALLEELVVLLEYINAMSLASPDGSVTLDAATHTRMRLALADLVEDYEKLTAEAEDVGLFYILSEIDSDDSYEEAQQVLADAHDAEIDFRVALIAATLRLLADPHHAFTTDVARQMAQAELGDLEWPPTRYTM